MQVTYRPNGLFLAKVMPTVLIHAPKISGCPLQAISAKYILGIGGKILHECEPLLALLSKGRFRAIIYNY